MADYFLKILHSLRNCNVAFSPALRLGGASEQLSGLCLRSHDPHLLHAWSLYNPGPRASPFMPKIFYCCHLLFWAQNHKISIWDLWLELWVCEACQGCKSNLNVILAWKVSLNNYIHETWPLSPRFGFPISHFGVGGQTSYSAGRTFSLSTKSTRTFPNFCGGFIFITGMFPSAAKFHLAFDMMI